MGIRKLFKDLLVVEEENDVLAMATVHGLLVVYAAAFWLTQPVLPYLSSELGADTVMFGYLEMCFSIVQVAGSGIIGQISDVHGNRVALLLGIAGSGLSYIMLGLSYNLPLLFLSRIPTLTMHNMQASQAFVTLLSKPDDRAKALGRLSLSYGIGMILGTSLGGFLSNYLGYHGVAWLSGFLNYASIPFIYMNIPANFGLASRVAKKKKMELEHIPRILKAKHSGSVLSYMAGMSLAFGVYKTTNAMYLKNTYNVTAEKYGYIQSGGAVVGALTNVFIVGWLTHRLNEFQTLKLCSATMLVTFSILTVVESEQLFYITMVPLVISGAILYTVTTSLISKCNVEGCTATLIGLSHSTRSISGIVAPVVGGYALEYYGFPGVSIFGAIFSFFCLLKTFKFEAIFADFDLTQDQKKLNENPAVKKRDSIIDLSEGS